MLYSLRFQLHNRHYQPLSANTPVDEEPHYEPGKVYRLRLIGSTDDITTWPEFIVIKTESQLEQQTTVVQVYVVLLSESENRLLLIQQLLN